MDARIWNMDARCRNRTGAAGACLALLLVIGSAPAQGEAEKQAEGVPAVQSKTTGPHFEVRCHFDDADMAAQVLKVVEAAWPHTEALLGRKQRAPAQPMAVHLYERLAHFTAAEQQLTKGRFAENRGFSHHDSKSAHMLVIPDSSPSVRALVGVTRHFLRQLAHEAAHLTVYAAIPNFRHHPDWLAEGIATHVSEQVSREFGWSSAKPGNPFYDMRQSTLQMLRRRGLLLEPRGILQDEVDHLSLTQKYAVWWGFFQCMRAKHPNAFKQILRSAIALGAGSEYRQRLLESIQQLWPDDKLDKLDELNVTWRAWVDAYQPVWDESNRCIEVDGDTWTQTAYSGKNALAWRGACPGATYRIAGSVTILPSSNQQANVLIGGSNDNFVSIAFRVDGGVTILEHKDGAWTNHVHQAHALRTNEATAFAVHVDGTRVRVELGGRVVLAQRIQGLVIGRWGVGVQATGGSVWHDMVCTP